MNKSILSKLVVVSVFQCAAVIACWWILTYSLEYYCSFRFYCWICQNLLALQYVLFVIDQQRSVNEKVFAPFFLFFPVMLLSFPFLYITRYFINDNLIAESIQQTSFFDFFEMMTFLLFHISLAYLADVLYTFQFDRAYDRG